MPVVAAMAFGVPAGASVAMVIHRWRDRPAAWSWGWLCVGTFAMTYGAAAGVTAISPGVSTVVLAVGLASTGVFGFLWLVSRALRWWSARHMRRLVAAEGVEIPRGRLTAPVLVMLYLAGAWASVLAAAYLWASGLTWMGDEFLLAGVPLRVGLVPAFVLCAGCVIHLVVRELSLPFNFAPTSQRQRTTWRLSKDGRSEFRARSKRWDGGRDWPSIDRDKQPPQGRRR